MRELTKKQKVLLTKWVKESDKEIYSIDDLETSQWEELVEVNDTEVLWQNANRFIRDLKMEELI